MIFLEIYIYILLNFKRQTKYMHPICILAVSLADIIKEVIRKHMKSKKQILYIPN